MANKKLAAKKATVAKSETKITRISAKDTSSTPKKSAASVIKISASDDKKSVSVRKKKDKADKKRADKAAQKDPVATKNYFKGAWQELRLVRWPTRRATWKLTAAVLLFTAFFIVLVIAIDALFQYLSKLLLG